MSNYSLLKIINLWSQTSEVISNPTLLKHLKTVLKLYILKTLDKKFAVNKITPEEFDSFCHKTSIQHLQPENWINIFKENFSSAVASGKTSRSTQGNYSSALGRFLKWMREESWYQEIFLHNLPEKAPPHISVKRNKKKRIEDYEFGLKPDELSDELDKFIKNWREFWVKTNHLEEKLNETPQSYPTREELNRTSGERRKKREERKRENQELGTSDKPISTKLDKDKTLKNYTGSILRFLGWCVNIEGYLIDEITPDWITDKILLEDYATYLTQSRGCGSHSGLCTVTAALSVAKYLTYEDSKQNDWSDIPLVKSLRNLSVHYQGEYDKEKTRSDEEKWEKKEITHQQARQVVQYLYQLCARHDSKGNERSGAAILKAWRVYLIVKILVYAPIRQQEIRKLRVGSTLITITDSNGLRRYAVKIKTHKNSNKTGKPRYYPLPEILTKDLDIWLQVIRPTAIEAASSLEAYLNFFDGYSLEGEQKLICAIAEAKQGRTQKKVKSLEKYIHFQQRNLNAIQRRISSWDTARANAEVCDHVFFTLGASGNLGCFCEPYDGDRYVNIWQMVSAAVGKATLVLFGEARFLNPHGFRHIGSKHLRKVGKAQHKEAFSSLQGHSAKVDDEYAAQITKDYDLIEEIVDDWWE